MSILLVFIQSYTLCCPVDDSNKLAVVLIIVWIVQSTEKKNITHIILVMWKVHLEATRAVLLVMAQHQHTDGGSSRQNAVAPVTPTEQDRHAC